MPKVSVVILNWNGKKFLKNCLTSLSNLSYKPLEVIVIDNNSNDGSVTYVQRNFSWVRIVASKKNLGFAGGNNLGYTYASGKYILFLNNDTIVRPNFLSQLVKEMEADKTIGCLQPQMRIMNNKNLQDEAGAYLTRTGFLYHYGFRKNHSLPVYSNQREIFSVKGACMLVPKKVLEQVGLFDEDFYIFFEESDLCYRIWLAGFRVIYDPSVYIYHYVGGDTTKGYPYARRIYLTFKNMNCCYLKNFGTLNLLTIFPFFVGIQVLLVLFFLLTGKFDVVKAALSAYYWNFINIRHTLGKRYTIQKQRKIKDSALNGHFLFNPELSYLYYSIRNAQFYQDKPIHTV